MNSSQVALAAIVHTVIDWYGRFREAELKPDRWNKLRRVFYLFEDEMELTEAIECTRQKWRVYRDNKEKILFKQEFEKHKKAYKEVKAILPTIGKKTGAEQTHINDSNIVVILKKRNWNELEKMIGKPFEDGKCFRCLKFKIYTPGKHWQKPWQSSWVFPGSFQVILKKALKQNPI